MSGREGFAIAVEHLEAKSGEAIDTGVGFLFVDVRLFSAFPLYDTLRTLAGVYANERPETDGRAGYGGRTATTKSMRVET